MLIAIKVIDHNQKFNRITVHFACSLEFCAHGKRKFRVTELIQLSAYEHALKVLLTNCMLQTSAVKYM